MISLPPGTEMFQFPGFASVRGRMTGLAPRRVAPFGHLGLIACVRLPRAFRSLPRPSSPPCAQASPTCPRSLDYNKPAKQSTRDLLVATFMANVALQRVNGLDRRRDAGKPVPAVDRETVSRVLIRRSPHVIAAPADTAVRHWPKEPRSRGLSHDHCYHPLSNSNQPRTTRTTQITNGYACGPKAAHAAI